MKRSSSSPLPPVEPKRAFTSRKSTESFDSKHQSNDQNTKHDTIDETTVRIANFAIDYHRQREWISDGKISGFHRQLDAL